MLTGAVAALAVHTNITLVNFLPVLAFVHLRTVQERSGELPRVRALVARTAWALLGGILVTIMLGLVNRMVGREFFFFGSLLDLAMRFLSNPERYQVTFWRPWSTWLWSARDLALPATVFVAGTVSLIRPRATRRTDGIAAALVWQFLVMGVVWTIWQAAGQTALDPVYMAYPLQPACFLALAGLLVRTWPDVCERNRLALVTGTAILSAVTLGLLVPYFQPVAVLVAPSILIVGGLVFGAGLFVYLLRPGVTTTIVLIVTLVAGNLFAASARNQYAAADPCKIEPEIYSAVVEAEAWLAAVDPTYSHLRTWFEEQEIIHPLPGCNLSMGAIGSSMTSMSARAYVTNPFPMPAVDDVPAIAIQSLANQEAMLAIVSNTTVNLDRWHRRLESAGLVSTAVVQSHRACDRCGIHHPCVEGRAAIADRGDVRRANHCGHESDSAGTERVRQTQGAADDRW